MLLCDRVIWGRWKGAEEGAREWGNREMEMEKKKRVDEKKNSSGRKRKKNKCLFVFVSATLSSLLLSRSQIGHSGEVEEIALVPRAQRDGRSDAVRRRHEDAAGPTASDNADARDGGGGDGSSSS